MSIKYSIFPSHVSVQSFVTVKLSDKHTYGLWETQMLYLLEGHDMLGFVNESSPDVPGDEWKRWDVLVRGWILGSLSEHTSRQVLHRLKSKQTHFTAKHVWEQLRHMYGQQVEELEKERKEGSYAIDPKEFVEEERNRSRVKQDLYLAVECGKLQHVLSILQHKNIGITDSISINGNTALHIAVSNSDGFLHSMLELLPSDIPLKDVKNMDGSTLLHLAASCGNTNAAKILVGWSRDLLNAKDNQGFTPFDIILSQPMNKEMCLFFMKQQAPTTIAAHETLLNAISYKHFDLALAFIKKCNSFKSRAVLMAIAQNFPVDFTLNQLIIYELFRTPILQFITRGASDKKGYMKFADLVLKAGVTYPYKFLIRICMKLQVFKDLEVRMKEREDAKDLLDVVCALMRVHLDGEGEADTEPKYSYTEAMLEAIRRDASDVVDIIVHWFPEAALTVDEYGHNVAQIAWKNRAYKVYALIIDGKRAKHTSIGSQNMKQDHYGNNFLHFAARLAPTKKLDHTSSPPFQMQRELQWFKLAHEIVPQGAMVKNCFGETPEMVFTKEHKDLEIESGEWIKSAANAVAITTTIIITSMFATTIQIPGGYNEKGIPNMNSELGFVVFEVTIAVSAMAAALSLLLFLIILTSPRTQDDYMLRLPLTLVIGVATLFMSTSFGAAAFASALYLNFGTNLQRIIGLIVPTVALSAGIYFVATYWYISTIFSDFMYSTNYFFMLYAFRKLQLVGRIFI